MLILIGKCGSKTGFPVDGGWGTRELTAAQGGCDRHMCSPPLVP